MAPPDPRMPCIGKQKNHPDIYRFGEEKPYEGKYMQNRCDHSSMQPCNNDSDCGMIETQRHTLLTVTVALNSVQIAEPYDMQDSLLRSRSLEDKPTSIWTDEEKVQGVRPGS